MADDDTKAAKGAPPEAPAPQALYHLLGQDADDTGEVIWRELGSVKAASSDAALALAEQAARQRGLGTTPTEGDGPTDTTVAVVSDRFWVEGTATTEVKAVTSWRR